MVTAQREVTAVTRPLTTIAAAVLALVAALPAGAHERGDNEAALSGIPEPAPARSELTEMQRDVLRVCEGVVKLFDRHADEIWPGFDLSSQPFLVYIPNQVALLVNCEGSVEDYAAYPPGWPDLGARVCFREGPVEKLAGQLVFGYDAGGVRTVAIGFPESLPVSFEDPELKMLGYVVHEVFHEHQDQVFGEIEWAREQEYPVEDVENAALAYLEMALLVDAVDSAWADDHDAASEAIAQFTAVRDLRWGRTDDFVRIYEGGKETREGTARYVELKCLDLAGGMEYASSIPDAPPLHGALAHGRLPGSLLVDFRDSMVDGAVPVEDLPRNRIYPVAGAQAFLLDYLGVEWKPEAEGSTADFTYAGLLRDQLGLDEEVYPSLVETAMATHDYPMLVAAAEREVAGHRARYDDAVAAFEAQTGTRIEIRFNSNGLYRSRVTSAPKIVVDRGLHEFCSRYDVYTLERDETFFTLSDSGLLEVNEYDDYAKTVVFCAPSVSKIVVDGTAVDASPEGRLDLDGSGSAGSGTVFRSFSTLNIVGDGFELTHEGSGTVRGTSDGIEVDLTGP
jgi:hypothetical protein